MTTGNGVPTAADNSADTFTSDRSRNLRDIEDLVAKLQIVTKQLAVPPRSMPVQRSAVTSSAAASSADEFAHAQCLGLGEAGDPYGER